VAEWPIAAAFFALSPDAKLLAAEAPSTGVLSIYDTTTWKLKWEINEENRGMTGYVLDFSPNGKYLAGGGIEQNVYVWDMMTGQKVYEIDQPFYGVGSISFSPDNELLAISPAGGEEGQVMVWDMITGEWATTSPLQLSAKLTLPNGNEDVPEGYYGWNVNKMLFIPNQSNVVAISIGYHTNDVVDGVTGLYFWDIDHEELKSIFPGTWGGTMAISPNGRLLVMQMDGQVRVWDVFNSTEVLTFPNDEVYLLAINNEGVIVGINWPSSISMWNLKGELLATLPFDGKFIPYLEFTPTGELLVGSFAEEQDQPIEVWRINE